MAASAKNPATILTTRWDIPFSAHASGKNIESLGDSFRLFETSSRVRFSCLLCTHEAAPLNDNMVERAITAVKVIVAELRPEVAAVFSIFPSLLRLPSL